jgi:hypothetical protein
MKKQPQFAAVKRNRQKHKRRCSGIAPLGPGCEGAGGGWAFLDNLRLALTVRQDRPISGLCVKLLFFANDGRHHAVAGLLLHEAVQRLGLYRLDAPHGTM